MSQDPQDSRNVRFYFNTTMNVFNEITEWLHENRNRYGRFGLKAWEQDYKTDGSGELTQYAIGDCVVRGDKAMMFKLAFSHAITYWCEEEGE